MDDKLGLFIESQGKVQESDLSGHNPHNYAECYCVG
jgi:hypothetical protein